MYEIYFSHLIGILTLASYIYFLPKIDTKLLTANMPNIQQNITYISLVLVIISYFYMNFIFLKYPVSNMYIVSIVSFLFLSSLWAPSIYYFPDKKWTSVMILTMVSVCTIGFLMSWYHTDKSLSLILSIMYIMFHVIFIDNIMWSYYYLNLS